MQITYDLKDKIKKQLTEERTVIEKNLASLKAQDPFSDPDRLIDNAASDAEANEETSHDRVEAIEKELRLKLEDINQALIRINEGKYGVCQNCGRAIDEERLVAKPSALFCMDCAKGQEK